MGEREFTQPFDKLAVKIFKLTLSAASLFNLVDINCGNGVVTYTHLLFEKKSTVKIN